LQIEDRTKKGVVFFVIFLPGLGGPLTGMHWSSAPDLYFSPFNFMEKISYIALDQMSKHPNNPRYIKDEKFEGLKKSIQGDKKYFEVRPIILSNRTGKNVIIAGNRRFDAARELGWKDAPATIRKGLTEEQEIEILLKDNGSYGQWDWDMITNLGWDDILKEKDLGVDLPIDISIEQPKKSQHANGEERDPLPPEYKVEVSFLSEMEMEEFFKEVSDRGFNCRTSII
jgi:hypothetical protein